MGDSTVLTHEFGTKVTFLKIASIHVKRCFYSGNILRFWISFFYIKVNKSHYCHAGDGCDDCNIVSN